MTLFQLYLILLCILINLASSYEEKWFSLNPSSSYKVIEDKLSFWEAKKYCLKTFNSYLAVVANEKDSDKLATLLIERNQSSSWIGLSDFGRERQFYWTNDQDINSVDMWQKSFPNDFRNASDCVIMKRNDEGNYRWIDIHCASKHSFICMRTNKTDVIKSGLLPHHSHYINQCPQPFFPVDGDCFWRSSELLTWGESRLLCKEKSPESDLASIRTDFQQEYFAALISGSSAGYWIGLNYFDNVYQWILQQDIKILRWGVNEPKDPSKKNCAFISNNEHNLGHWYSGLCSNKFNAICQTLKKNNVSTSGDKTSIPDLTYDSILFKKGACEKPGYYYYHDSCYKLYNGKYLKHNDAIMFCKKQTFLNKTGYKFLVEVVSLPSAGEKNLILADLRRVNSDLRNNTVWLNIMANITEAKDSQGIQSKQLSLLNKIKHLCFKLLTNGVVNSSDCDDNSRGIPMCKYQLRNFDIKSLNYNKLSATCPKKWSLFNSFCYYFDYETFHSQYEAQRSCLKLDSRLISIDMHQQKYLTDFFKKNLMHFNDITDVWIGLEAVTSNGSLQFNWSNRNPVTYLNLESTNVTVKREKWCSVFVANLELWRLTNCTQVSALRICQRMANITMLQTSRNNSMKKVQNKATLKPGYYTKYDFLTWKAARERCKGLPTKKGHISTLATINSYSELMNIKRITKRKNIEMFWIGISGLYNHFDNIFLQWADGSKIVFQNYQLENLMNLTGTENCVMMSVRTGKWLVSNCDIKRPFVCRIIDNTTTEIKKDIRLNDLLPQRIWNGSKFCPKGFHEFSNKCYLVIENRKISWTSADQYCQGLVPHAYRVEASLASIESRFENSFVYSLLSSSIHSTNDTRYWIGDRYTPTNNSVHLCAGMSSHPDPYIGARWFSEDCSKPLKFICSSLKIPIEEPPLPISQCPNFYVEYNNSIGTSCYHFEDYPNTIKEARTRCKLQNSNTLLSLPSHYHLHFMLSQYEKLGWSRDTPIWLGSEIEQSQKYYHWQWDDGEDVRYTFWNKIPNLNDKRNGPLCLYLLQEKTKNGRFGIQIDECRKLTYKGYLICEYSFKNKVQRNKESYKKNCLINSQGNTYEGDMNTTMHGLRCVRWDLLKKSNHLLQSIRNDPVKHNYLQYHANECRYVADMLHLTTFCAITPTTNDSMLLQECIVELCRHKILDHKEEVVNKEHHSNVTTVVIVTMLLLICVIACIALLSWRRWNKSSLFGGYLRRGQFSLLNSQSRGTSFNNPIYRPVNC